MPVFQTFTGHKELEKLNEEHASKEAILMKADHFLRQILLHSTVSDPNVMVRCVM